jgi:hypothetical protein
VTDVIRVIPVVPTVSVTVEENRVSVSAVGAQGPPGAGFSGTVQARRFVRGNDAGTTLISDDVHYRRGVADEAVNALRAVRPVAGERLAAALATDLAQTAACLGLAITAASAAGETLEYQVSGELSDLSWAWTPGAALYLSDAGLLSETPGIHVRRLAIALAPTKILVELGPAIGR